MHSEERKKRVIANYLAQSRLYTSYLLLLLLLNITANTDRPPSDIRPAFLGDKPPPIEHVAWAWAWV